MRAALLAYVLSVCLVVGAPMAFADDCTDTGDCAMAPRNIDAATGIAAAGPFIALAWLYLSRRNGGAPVSEAEPRSADELAGDLAAVKEAFERLQEELRDRAVDELRKLDEFMKNYDDKWREGMFALEDYLQEYQNLLPGLQKIWEQYGSREDARRIAEAVDEAIMMAQIGVGLARSTASTAAREALDVGRRAGTRLEAEAVRRAAREALGKEVQAVQAAERAAAGRAGREAAVAGRREAAEVANDVRRAVQEGRGTGKLVLTDELATSASRIPPKPGYFDVVVHGNRDTVMIMRNGRWVEVNPQGLRALMERAGYKGGPVRLLSCNTGGKVVAGKFEAGVARALSEELRAPVIAPSETLWLRGNGAVWASETKYAPIQHWNSYGMREYGVSSGALTADEAKFLGY